MSNKRAPCHAWSKDEDESLREMFYDGTTDPEMAETLKVSQDQIEKRRLQLDLHKRRGRGPDMERRLEVIRAVHCSDGTLTSIAKRLKVTKGGAHKMLTRLIKDKLVKAVKKTLKQCKYALCEPSQGDLL